MSQTISDAHQYGCSVVSWSPEIQKKRFASGGWDIVVKIWSYDAGNWVNVAKDPLMWHTLEEHYVASCSD